MSPIGDFIPSAFFNASFKLETTVMPFIIRGVKLWGINSVDTPMKRREFVWSQAANLIDMKKLDEITQIWSLSKLIDSYDKILKGEVAGRVVIGCLTI